MALRSAPRAAAQRHRGHGHGHDSPPAVLTLTPSRSFQRHHRHRHGAAPALSTSSSLPVLSRGSLMSSCVLLLVLMVATAEARREISWPVQGGGAAEVDNDIRLPSMSALQKKEIELPIESSSRPRDQNQARLPSVSRQQLSGIELPTPKPSQPKEEPRLPSVVVVKEISTAGGPGSSQSESPKGDKLSSTSELPVTSLEQQFDERMQKGKLLAGASASAGASQQTKPPPALSADNPAPRQMLPSASAGAAFATAADRARATKAAAKQKAVTPETTAGGQHKAVGAGGVLSAADPNPAAGAAARAAAARAAKAAAEQKAAVGQQKVVGAGGVLSAADPNPAAAGAAARAAAARAAAAKAAETRTRHRLARMTPPTGGVTRTPPPTTSGGARTPPPAGESSKGAASTPFSGLGEGYWSVQGRDYIDKNGKVVRFSGVNWSGFETPKGVFGGLHVRKYGDHLDQMKALGFNVIRLPFAGAILTGNVYPMGGMINANWDLQGMSSLRIMDKMIEEIGKRGIKVILDYHRMHQTYAPEIGTWFDQRTPESVWINNWRMLAQRYKGNPTVIGADLFNEIHNNPKIWNWPKNAPFWVYNAGKDEAFNFRRASIAAIDAITAVEPNWIIFLEGMWDANYWWGGDCAQLLKAPLSKPGKNKLAYSTHDYGPYVANLWWFKVANYPNNLKPLRSQRWGFLMEQNIAPVWVGEFGSMYPAPTNSTNRAERLAFTTMIDYIKQLGASWTIAFWGPDTGDTGSILNNDWYSVNQEKMQLLAPIMHPGFR